MLFMRILQTISERSVIWRRALCWISPMRCSPACRKPALKAWPLLARNGVQLSLSHASISGVDLASLNRLNVRYVSLAAVSVGVGVQISAGLPGFVQSARALRIQIMISHVGDPRHVHGLARTARYASGPAFAAPRKLKRTLPNTQTYTPPPDIIGMMQPSTQYPVWFVDIWGVIHNGFKPFTQTVDTLAQHRAHGGMVVLVSNSPRSEKGVTLQLDQIGVRRDAYDAAVTSGDVTQSLMQEEPSGKLFHLGPARDLSLFEGLPVSVWRRKQAGAIICTGLFHDDRETPDDYATFSRNCAPATCP